MKHPVDA